MKLLFMSFVLAFAIVGAMIIADGGMEDCLEDLSLASGVLVIFTFVGFFTAWLILVLAVPSESIDIMVSSNPIVYSKEYKGYVSESALYYHYVFEDNKGRKEGKADIGNTYFNVSADPRVELWETHSGRPTKFDGWIPFNKAAREEAVEDKYYIIYLPEG